MSHYKPYPAYKDSGVEWIGNVPKDWGVKPVKIIASCNDDSLPESIPPDSPIRYVDISAVSHDGGISGAERMLFGEAPSRARRKAKVGDVVVSTVRTYLKAVASVDEAHADCVYSTGFAVLRARSERLAPEFLKWLALNELLIQAVESHSEGLSYPAINASELVNLKTVVPGLSEQRRIASVLDRETIRIDALIAKKTEFIDLLAKKRQVLITHAVTKGLDPKAKKKDSGVEWIGEVPEHWMAAPIKYVGRLESGHTPSRSIPAYWENCTVPWFTLADIWQVRKAGRKVITETSELVSELGLANSSARRLPSGTVVLSRTASVGFPAILGCEMATSQDFAAWICGKRLHNEFLYFCLIAMRGELNRLMMGSTHKTIYMPDIEQFRCPLPPISEQCQIAAYIQNQIDRFKQLTDKTQLSIDLLKKRRSALITAAVTGQIDLRESA